MNNERQKNLILIILLIGVITMTVAYANLSQRLNIKSSAKVQSKSTSWDVHFKNVSCTGTGYAVVTSPLAPTTGNTTELSGLVATFRAPGDSVSCTFYVENSGEIDAAITSFAKQDSTKTITYTGSGSTKAADEALINGKITYSLVYVDNNKEPAIGDVLASSATRQLKLTLSLPSTMTSLPTNDVTITNFASYIIYGQH
jgi:hypothetical protein